MNLGKCAMLQQITSSTAVLCFVHVLSLYPCCLAWWTHMCYSHWVATMFSVFVSHISMLSFVDKVPLRLIW